MGKPSINPVAWHPEKAPPRAKQDHGPDPFPRARLLPLPATTEDVAVDAKGLVVCAMVGGRVVTLDPATGNLREIGDVGEGRPLGLEVLPDGRILVCHDHRGLLRLNPVDGAVETLVGEVAGEPLLFTSNAVVQADGTIWFSQSTRRFVFATYLGDILEHSAAGRLFRRDPGGSVDVVLDGLQFPNGIALTADEKALILAETGAYQLSRVDLGSGRRELIATNLPALPDNMSRRHDGNIWVAMVTPRNPLLDSLGPYPALRRAVWAMPEWLRPKPARTAWAMLFSPTGELLRDVQAPRQDFWFTSGLIEG